MEKENIHIKYVKNFKELGNAMCYFYNTPKVNGESIGAIGNLEFSDEESGIQLLKICEENFEEKGKKLIIAPMNGNTWNQYRTIKYSNGAPKFILENVSPIEYNSVFEKAGYKEIYTYTSTKGLLSDAYSSRALDKIEGGLKDKKINIRNFDKQNYMKDLEKIYNIAVKSFVRNPLYTPVSKEEFIGQYTKYIKLVDEELILIAEQENQEIGFIFCIPDLNEMQLKGKIETVVVKTVAVLPEFEKDGIGNIMLRKIARKAIEKNYEKWIFAFMYSNNTSQRMATRNKTEVIREYALYGKEI